MDVLLYLKQLQADYVPENNFRHHICTHFIKTYLT